MSAPRSYEEAARRLPCAIRCDDDEQLVRRIGLLRHRLAQSKKRGSAALREFRLREHELAVGEATKRGLDVRGVYFRPRQDLTFSTGAAISEDGTVTVMHEEPPEKPRRPPRPEPPAPSDDAGTLLQLLEASVAAAVQRNGNGSNGNGRLDR